MFCGQYFSKSYNHPLFWYHGTKVHFFPYIPALLRDKMSFLVSFLLSIPWFFCVWRLMFHELFVPLQHKLRH